MSGVAETDAGPFDYAVLGGGTAGCVLASRLSEDPGTSVCLVEAGPDYGPYGDGRWPADLLATFSLADSHDWSSDEGSLRSARVLGGCSAHNACFVLRGAPEDYDEWGEGWSHADLAPYLDRAADAIDAQAATQEDSPPWARAVREAAGEIGMSVGDEPDGDPVIEGFAGFPVNAPHGVRWNSAFAYLDPARGRDNLQVVPDSPVDRLELRGSTAGEAVLQGAAGERRVRAERFVLAAGAFGSPAILLRSGIGPAEHLRELSIPVHQELPVGEGLKDHYGMGIVFDPSDQLRRESSEYGRRPGAFAATGLLKLRSRHAEDGVWDGHSVPFTGWRQDESGARTDEIYVSLSSHVMKPRSAGLVRLRSRDAAALPLVDNRFGSDDDGHDLAVIIDGLRRVRELASTGAIRAVVSGELEPTASIDNDDGWRGHARQALSSYYHPTSTCALGRVVDRDTRVLGLDNVHVVDASIMPTIPRANTNLSTLAVAERAVDLLRR
jgi:choline dehydrogenase